MIANHDDEWALGLFSLKGPPPGPEDFAAFYSRALEWFQRIGQGPTHLAIMGKGYTDKYVKIGGAATKKMIATDFAGITDMGIALVPEGSDAPAYDLIASINLGWLSAGELSLSIEAKDQLIHFGSPLFTDTLKHFLGWVKWNFGFVFLDKLSRDPLLHILSASNGNLSSEEDRVLNQWYASTFEERCLKPRDVYPVNILNSNHLQLDVRGQTLGEYIRQVPGTSVEEISVLIMWTVPIEAVDGLRKDLGAAGVLIARS